MNPRRITDEQIDLMALRWARAQAGRYLNNINIDCFVAGFKACQEAVKFEFGNLLMEEGQYYQHQYAKDRMESIANSGSPLTNTHSKEFDQAEQFGSELEKLGRDYKFYCILPLKESQ